MLSPDFVTPRAERGEPRTGGDNGGTEGDGGDGVGEPAQLTTNMLANIFGEFTKAISGSANKGAGEKRAEKDGTKLSKIQREGLGVLLREAEGFRRADELNNGAIVRAIQEATLTGPGQTLSDVLRRDEGSFERRLSANCATRDARDAAWRSYCISCMDEYEGTGWRARLRESSSMSVIQRSGEKVEDYHNRFKAAWRDSNWKRALVDRIALRDEEAASQFLAGIEASAQLHVRDALLMRAPDAILTVHDIYSVARAHAQNQIEVRRVSKRRRDPSPRREAPRELRVQAVDARPRRKDYSGGRARVEGRSYNQRDSRSRRDRSRPRNNDRRREQGNRQRDARRSGDRGRDRDRRQNNSASHGQSGGRRSLN